MPSKHEILKERPLIRYQNIIISPPYQREVLSAFHVCWVIYSTCCEESEEEELDVRSTFSGGGYRNITVAQHSLEELYDVRSTSSGGVIRRSLNIL